MTEGGRNHFQISLPTAGFLVGLLAGVADWRIVVHDSIKSAMWFIRPSAPVAIVWTSVTICTAAGIVFSLPGLRRLRGPALAGPGLLFLLVHEAQPIIARFGLSIRGVLLAWLAVVLLASIPLSLLPIRPVRRLPLWIGGTLSSAIILAILAVNPDLGSSFDGRRSAAVDGSKNVVLIFLDTVRYDDVFGSRNSAMPNLAAFARRSISFDSAWAPAPWTVPSHYSVLTGAAPWRVPFAAHGFHANLPTLAMRFRERGYDTAAILANPILGTPDFSPGFRYFTYPRASGVCLSALGELVSELWVIGGPRSPLCEPFPASEVTSRALRFVRGTSRPYFLVVNYMDAHFPYDVSPDCRGPGSRMLTFAERQAFSGSSEASPAAPRILELALQQHRAAARCMDRSLGALLTTVGQEPGTVVAVVADHGEQFGEHGLVQHGNSLYAQLLHVPLIVETDGRESRVAGPVSATDLYEWLQLLARPSRGGPSLPLTGAAPGRAAISSYETAVGEKRTGGFSVVQGNDHFILQRNGDEALFDLAADPTETTPIPTTSGPGASIAAPLRALARHAAAETDPHAAEFRALGYIH